VSPGGDVAFHLAGDGEILGAGQVSLDDDL
jgi:hypothetical protein